jgi:hypothetical protein
MRDSDNNLVLNSDGSKLVLPLAQNKMVSFADKEAAITACPTYAAKCGNNKMFNFKSTVFNKEYNTANVVI